MSSTRRQHGSADGGNGHPGIPDVEQAWRILTLVNDWIRHAEAKAAASLAATGAFVVVLYYLVKDQTQPGATLDVIALATSVSLAVAAGSALAALVPRVRVGKATAERTSVNPSVTANLLFFGDVAHHYSGAADRYEADLSELLKDRDRLHSQIAGQIQANAVVADRKLRWTNRAIRSLALTVLFMVLTAAIVSAT